MRSHAGDPTADMALPGPLAIGRFDLRAETPLQPIDVSGGLERRSGVWDVLAHPNGRVYFTSYFEAAGSTDPRTGRTEHFDGLGNGLNELELGPDGSLLASRYSPAPGTANGSIVAFDARGARLYELPLSGPEGYTVAPKTVAYDRLRREIWVTTDVLPDDPQKPTLHDAIVLDTAGRELRRFTEREMQFVAFAPDGARYAAVVTGRELTLHIGAPGEVGLGQGVVLDPDFASEFDFVQDIQFASDGRAVIARWSGKVHVVAPAPTRAGRRPVRRVAFPVPESGGLYYSAFVAGERICATLCSEVAVVCQDGQGPAAR